MIILGYNFRLQTSAVLETSAWYHFVLAVDTTQATASNRVKLYINGSQVTDFNVATYPSQNFDSLFGAGGTHRIGTEGTNNREFFDGYLAEFILVDGSQLDATSFGETKSGIWIPKDVSGLTFGSGGYHLDFADSSSLGNDVSGNNNDFTSSGLASTDVVLDSPTNNFPTILPDKGGTSQVYTEGGLHANISSIPTL